jgi:serine/threonine protein kinase/tetratricopeptide (TPR) repeat protein
MTEPPLPEESIFAEALEITSAAERAAFLDRACGQDKTLRAEVEELLHAQERSGDLLDLPENVPLTTHAPAGEIRGITIGPYKLLEPIGEGGMGTVWMAEQTEPIQRRVAVKVIKAGMDSRQVLARFEAERQALALMEHPNIAKVLDAGKTPSGRPYFVMELVKGRPITSYCDEKRIGVRERLQLFGDVCRAVQHAHQKGIIHRDLKPSNVLVAPYDGKPVVKVIDFGVAKATGQRLTEKTLFTGFGGLVGTPEYMSPEQSEVNNEDIDTRSDIYSLGVLLYELLTGSTPLTRKRLKEAALEEVLRVIREEEPPRPSTRLSASGDSLPAISSQRQTEPAKLTKLVRGELDWIVMKALEKDRIRRYETANGLAMDVQRYLTNEPVHACPPSALYRLRKLARRNKGLLTAAAVVFLSLVAGTAVATWQAVRATLAERRAVAERNRAETGFRMARDAVDRSLTQVSQSPLLKVRGLERFRRDQIESAREFYERFVHERFDAPEVRYDLGLAHLRLAEIDRELGNYPAAEESAVRAVTLLGALAEAHPKSPEYQRDLAAGHVAVGLVLADSGRLEEAEAAYQRAIAIQEKQVAEHPELSPNRYALAKTLNSSGFTFGRANRVDPSAMRLRQALDVLDKASDDDAPGFERQSLLAQIHMNLAQLILFKGRYDEGKTAFEQAARLYREMVRRRPDSGPEVWESLGRCLTQLGRAYNDVSRSNFEKAEEVQQEGLQIFEKLVSEHPDVHAFAYDLGRCYQELAHTAKLGGRPGDAQTRYVKAIEILEGAASKGYKKAGEVAVTARIGRAVTLAIEGNHARAAAEAESLARRQNLTPVHVYDIAGLYSMTSAAAERDPKLSAADRTRLKARYADRAMEYLRDALSRDYGNPGVLKGDSDLDPVRSRADFRKLLADLEAQEKLSGNRGETGAEPNAAGPGREHSASDQAGTTLEKRSAAQ